MLTTRTTYHHHKDSLNYYQLLDISERASRKEIIQAYLKLIRKTMLDNQDQNEQLINIQIVKYRTAYKMLSNDNTRRDYDQQLLRSNRT